ncbi:Hypothetical predicted protein [Mytilus galloprovincialis]|uniref:Uncharacterized protein n=1 Tax=Mytilus galloprovincialis TaxID=29158 RepID=A0A8B6FZX8_MYTGA|nr:Hypothetical predicted protein [Mytilus galloprovincialis]
MSTSLQKLVKNLAKEGSSRFQNMTSLNGEEKIRLFLRKQEYPLEYVDCSKSLTKANHYRLKRLNFTFAIRISESTTIVLAGFHALNEGERKERLASTMMA